MSGSSAERSAAALRERFLHAWVGPAVRARFDAHPVLQSAALCVAQYWDDQAHDAVHGLLIYSELPAPEIGFGLGSLDFEDEVHVDATNLPSFPEGHGTAGFMSGFEWHEDLATPAFAAFCSEGASQDDLPKDAYTAYAIFRRSGAVDVIGRKLRPHLDGLPSERWP